MKNQKILRKLEDLNLFKQITIFKSGNVVATLESPIISNTAYRQLLSRFNPKKFRVLITILNSELVVKISKLPQLRPHHNPIIPQSSFPDFSAFRSLSGRMK